MMCTKSCTPKVDSALRAVPGVINVTVSLEKKNAVVTGSADVTALIAAVNATGKKASLPSSASTINRAVTLNIDGMMCTKSCTPKVDSALRAVPGVINVTVSLEENNAVVTGSADVTALIAVVNATGKKASLPSAAAVMSSPPASPKMKRTGDAQDLTALSLMTDDGLMTDAHRLRFPNSEGYRAAVTDFGKAVCCPNVDCICAGLCGCGALCACGTTVRNNEQWDDFMSEHFNEVETMAQAALQFNTNACPYSDCDCGLDCGCGSECLCGSKKRSEEEMVQMSMAQIRVGIKPSAASMREASNWLAGSTAGQVRVQGPSKRMKEKHEDNPVAAFGIEAGSMGAAAYSELQVVDVGEVE